MDIFPAIDLRNGKAVRLVQGDYERMTVYGDDPLTVAARFMKAGAENLHVVDLDGAKDGSTANFDTIKKIVESTDMFVEVGGGIRDEDRICRYLDIGAGRVILGTVAAKEPEFTRRMIKKYGNRIAIGVDAKEGKVAVGGWLEVTDADSYEFVEKLRDEGVSSVIYTDISRDGGLSGTNIDAYRRLSKIKGIDITASGGISFESEIKELKGIVSAAILGKALYSGTLNLEKCIKLAK